MIKDMHGNKITPTEVAKELVWKKVDDVYFWDETYEGLADMVTEKEYKAIQKAITKQVARVNKLMGCQRFGGLGRLS